MTTENNQPPEARIPTQEELLELSGQVHGLIKDCITELEPAHTLGEKVQLAILVKLLKMYHNLFRIADSGDSHTPVLLSRIIFEFALSFTYMCVNDQAELDIYEKFRRSALVRTHMALKATKKSKTRNRKSSTDLVKTLETMLAQENYDITQPLGDIPKSWHPTVTYMKMAYSLSDEFKDFYNNFYEVTSTAIHPNWLDLRKEFITDNQGEARANLMNGPTSILPLAIATCVMLQVAETCRVKFIQRGNDRDSELVAIEVIKQTHHQLHN